MSIVKKQIGSFAYNNLLAWHFGGFYSENMSDDQYIDQYVYNTVLLYLDTQYVSQISYCSKNKVIIFNNKEYDICFIEDFLKSDLAFKYKYMCVVILPLEITDFQMDEIIRISFENGASITHISSEEIDEDFEEDFEEKMDIY
jgi:hypothetical protein